MHEIFFYTLVLIFSLTFMQYNCWLVEQYKLWERHQRSTRAASSTELEMRFNEAVSNGISAFIGTVLSIASSLLIIWTIVAYCNGFPLPSEAW